MSEESIKNSIKSIISDMLEREKTELKEIKRLSDSISEVKCDEWVDVEKLNGYFFERSYWIGLYESNHSILQKLNQLVESDNE